MLSLLKPALGIAASKIFGGDDDDVTNALKPTAANFNAGGLRTSNTGGVVTVTPSARRVGLIDALAGKYSTTAGQFGGLRAKLDPGNGLLTNSTRDLFRENRRRVVGSLRDNFARRRIAGSSFAADALSRAEAEITLQEQRAVAEAMMQEIQTSANLIASEGAASAASVEAQLHELNLQANIGANLATNYANAANALAKPLAEFNQSRLQNRGAMIADVIHALPFP